MARTRINDESTVLRLPLGTLERIKKVLNDREPQAEFLRLAVLRELDLREASRASSSNTVSVDFKRKKPGDGQDGPVKAPKLKAGNS